MLQDCKSLKAVTLPTGIKLIGIHAFSCCSALESINLPFGLLYIDANAFVACKSSRHHLAARKRDHRIFDHAFANWAALLRASRCQRAALKFLHTRYFPPSVMGCRFFGRSSRYVTSCRRA